MKTKNKAFGKFAYLVAMATRKMAKKSPKTSFSFSYTRLIVGHFFNNYFGGNGPAECTNED